MLAHHGFPEAAEWSKFTSGEIHFKRRLTWKLKYFGILGPHGGKILEQ